MKFFKFTLLIVLLFFIMFAIGCQSYLFHGKQGTINTAYEENGDTTTYNNNESSSRDFERVASGYARMRNADTQHLIVKNGLNNSALKYTGVFINDTNDNIKFTHPEASLSPTVYAHTCYFLTTNQIPRQLLIYSISDIFIDKVRWFKKSKKYQNVDIDFGYRLYDVDIPR